MSALRSIAPILLVLASFVLPSVAASAQAETFEGKVIGVMDGDTIEVLTSGNTPRRIRLEGIDAPEKAQAFGKRSKQHLSDLVFGKQVQIVSHKTDQYGRTVGKVLVNGQDANLAQVTAGMAWHYKEYAKEQSASDRLAYANAELAARSAKAGLWVDTSPVPPWDWRHGSKETSTTHNPSASSGCPCGSPAFCTGPRGGQYCIAANGKKRY